MFVCVSIQKRREREIQQQMETRDEETLELKETYSSLQQEVDIKTKKLKKVACHPYMEKCKGIKNTTKKLLSV